MSSPQQNEPRAEVETNAASALRATDHAPDEPHAGERAVPCGGAGQPVNEAAFAETIVPAEGSGETRRSAPPAGPVRYQRIKPHARGGLGEISIALDEELQRNVALKEIRPEHAESADVRECFAAEARVTGSLEHPGIVAVYGFGQYDDGRLFYAMRFIEGSSLKEAIDRFHQTDWSGRPNERNLELRSLLGRFVDLCNATAYAHSRGIVHRDIKPANVMLGDYGETLLVDWGLALNRRAARAVPLVEKGSAETSELAETISVRTGGESGAIVGTPAFMSPEQASGGADVGPASDIYSLGATLYYLLCGRHPFSAKNLDEMLRQVRAGDFTPPHRNDARVPRALSGICGKAMSLRPEDRYASSVELAADIEHWLADEPVTAYREPLRARLARWTRRHRAWTQAAALSLVVVALVAVAATVLINGARGRERIARGRCRATAGASGSEFHQGPRRRRYVLDEGQRRQAAQHARHAAAAARTDAGRCRLLSRFSQGVWRRSASEG